MGWLQGDSELDALRQRRMQELMAQRGGGGVSLWGLNDLAGCYDDDFLDGK
jgi:hypothetical protein